MRVVQHEKKEEKSSVLPEKIPGQTSRQEEVKLLFS
jgi:hypothetical protein